MRIYRFPWQRLRQYWQLNRAMKPRLGCLIWLLDVVGWFS